MLMVREELLHQRASLTIDKLQLEERKQFLAKSLEIQRKERKELENKEHNVKEAIHKLKSFIATFQKCPPQCPIPAAPTRSSTKSLTVTCSKSSSQSPSEICNDNNPLSTSSSKLYSVVPNTSLQSKKQKTFYIASNSCSISSASFPTPTKVVSSPSLLHCSTFSSFPAHTKALSDKSAAFSVSPLLPSHSSSQLSPQQAYLPTLSHPRPASPSIGLASYPHGSHSPRHRSYSQRTLSPEPVSYPQVNLSPEPAPHTCHSPLLGHASSYPYDSPERTNSQPIVSSSPGQTSVSLGVPSPAPMTPDPCTSPKDSTVYIADSPVSHLHPDSNTHEILGSSSESLECQYTNSRSTKFPCKRKLCNSESVFHDHKTGLATRMNESDAMTASS